MSPSTTTTGVSGTTVFTATVTDVTGGTVSAVNFTSSDTGVVTVSPASDAASPYITTATAQALGSETITAQAIIGGIARCSDVAIYNVAAPTPTPTPVCALINAPAQVNVEDVVNNIRVTWTDSSANETGFNVYRRGPSDSDFVLQTASPLPANTTVWNDPNEICGVNYLYGVRAMLSTAPPSCPSESAMTTGSGVCSVIMPWFQAREGDMTAATQNVGTGLPPGAPPPYMMEDGSSGLPGMVFGRGLYSIADYSTSSKGWILNLATPLESLVRRPENQFSVMKEKIFSRTSVYNITAATLGAAELNSAIDAAVTGSNKITVGGITQGGISPTPTPVPAGLITDLSVNDSDNRADWSIQANIQGSSNMYGDRTYNIGSLPASLAGLDWIRTADDSKNYSSSPVVYFKVTQNATVYVAHDDRVTDKPTWLLTWTDTGMDLVNTEPVTFSIYSKTYSAGSAVSLGTNGVASTASMYTIIVRNNTVPTSTPSRTPTPQPSSPTPTINPSSSTIKIVHHGAVTLAGGSASVNVNFPAVIMNRSYLTFTTRYSGTNASCEVISGQVSSTTQATFSRLTACAGESVDIQWSVAEFLGGVNVYRGSTTITSTAQSITIPSVNTSRAFPLISWRNDQAGYTGKSFFKGKITGSTTLQLEVGSATQTAVVEWQVVEMADAEVYTGDAAMTDTTSSYSVVLGTPIVQSRSFLLFSQTGTTGVSANIGQKMVQGKITGTSGLSFTRDQTGMTVNITWYLVQLPAGSLVQTGELAFAAETTKQIGAAQGLTAVIPSRSLAFNAGWLYSGGRTPYSSSANPGVVLAASEIINGGTDLSFTRNNTASSATIQWFLVQFPGQTPTSTPTSIPSPTRTPTPLPSPTPQPTPVVGAVDIAVVYRSGDLTLSEATNIGDRKTIIVTDGNVNINGNLNLNDDNGFLLVLAGGNITVSPGVGEATYRNISVSGGYNSPQLEGIFYAQGTFNTGTVGITGTDIQLRTDGTVIGMEGVTLGRNVAGIYSAEYFNFRPEMTYLVHKLGLRKKVTQELTNP